MKLQELMPLCECKRCTHLRNGVGPMLKMAGTTMKKVKVDYPKQYEYLREILRQVDVLKLTMLRVALAYSFDIEDHTDGSITHSRHALSEVERLLDTADAVVSGRAKEEDARRAETMSWIHSEEGLN